MVESISFETLMNADGMAAFRWFDGLKQDETGLISSSQEAWPHGFSSVFNGVRDGPTVQYRTTVLEESSEAFLDT